MTHLCLVRHGQTDWNLEGRYQGQNNVPLNQTGRSEARTLAQKLRATTFSAVYSSDLKRASETADLIAEVVMLPVQADPRLREIDQGEWEGQLVRDIQARYAELWQRRTEDPANVRPPGGETVEEVARRVSAALDDIARAHPGASVLVVSHGLALATAVCFSRGMPVGQAYTIIPGNADPVWIDWGE